MNKKQLQTMLEVIGAFALIQGAVGLIHEFTGWLGWGLIERVPFLAGREVYGSIALVVLAIALFAAADAQKKA
ncbi:hypothetical protein [Streptomyces sp. VRA16 Mangrove soil]|uniref:hypothetical protein n=1 Tax=Streptomyces sp. VRA16 Mangrove soil TaxID=2817434 RepID=UPI001A9CE210|nr:hypothetical protein [Streptomyces sp. VRA16 Mangrove soil]MBO1331259.1 hypothetical protein [Streptomyces sp. VRA16 Mangrove soil]